MMGDPGSEKENGGPTPGLYLLAAQDIFSYLETVWFNILQLIQELFFLEWI